MSFILDALKKSESDRQRKSRLESAYIPTGSGNAKPSRWIWVVAGLLLINVVVLLVFIAQPGTPVPPSTTSEPAAARDLSETETPDGQSFRDMVVQARKNQPEATQTDAVSASPSTTDAKPVVSPPARSEPAPTTSSGPSTLTVVYPTFNEVRVNGSVILPELHLDIHVYSDASAERFIFVNMSKYRENGTLTEGPRVTEIVPEGVILEYTGIRFLLPRE